MLIANQDLRVATHTIGPAVGAEDNDERLGERHGGKDLRDSTIVETWTDSSTDTEIAKHSFEQSRSRIPTERLSSSSILHTTIRDNMSSSRKRAARPDNNPFSTDESAPIIQHAQGGAKDYSSISPSISARTNSVGHTNGNSSGLVGTTGTTRSMQWESREHSATQREEAERHAAEQERRESSKWRKFLDKYGSVELENKGSVARDHLALERTFLAWLRTSLSFASIGIAITQLFRLNTAISNPPPNNTSNSSSPSIDSETPQVRLRHVGKPLGATFIAISILILCIGFHRYFEAQHYVIRGKFPASRGSIMLVSAVAGGLIISSLVVILAIAPRAFEN